MYVCICPVKCVLKALLTLTPSALLYVSELRDGERIIIQNYFNQDIRDNLETACAVCGVPDLWSPSNPLKASYCAFDVKCGCLETTE